MDIFKPQNFRDWLQRLLSFRVLLAFLLVAITIIFEFRFFWIEQTLGAYLLTTNARRPKSGKIWESGLKAQSARNSLGQLIASQINSQYNIHDAGNFGDVYNRLATGQQVMVSPDHFRRMYANLPLKSACQVNHPIQLLKMIKDDQWQRVLYKRSPLGLEAYFLDGSNQTLKKVTIAPALLQPQTINTLGEVAHLDNNPIYKEILTADRFFDTIAQLPEKTQDNFFVDPKSVIALSGQLVRVGLSDQSKSGITQIGLEMVADNQIYVIPQKGFTWAIEQLKTQLVANENKDAAIDSDLDAETTPEVDLEINNEFDSEADIDEAPEQELTKPLHEVDPPVSPSDTKPAAVPSEVSP